LGKKVKIVGRKRVERDLRKGLGGKGDFGELGLKKI